MVFYSLDKETRLRVYFVLAAISLAISYGISSIPFVANNRWAYSPSVLVVFGLLVGSFNKFLWRLPIINRLTEIPDLSGVWKGQLEKADPPEASEPKLDITLSITQTWQKIDLVLESDETRSHSKVVRLNIENSRKVAVAFLYSVEPTKGNQEGKYSEGYNKLMLSTEGSRSTLGGPYFASKLRRGHLSVTKQQ